ncbi:MAG: TetM/TetW/TetO/TetS family tetracycline resistance ribosomal protection protein [Eubacteriales bacterium]|nr:TetM/TetW/TetO/TetS family tetracycline resistance ribosomal protection protein [Eubacteriales bacterium]
MDKSSENKPNKNPQKHICAALLAHVDAGKTTLSEGILYTAGTIRQMGRVDNQNTFLDNDTIERDRGITVYSKQAVFDWEDTHVTLLDTPGHVDFSAEMERTLQVLDYAVLVVSGADGVQSHTETLWQLFERYDIPVFLFVNKMDQPGSGREKLMEELRRKLSDGCTDFGTDEQQRMEAAAMCEEDLLEDFLETGRVAEEEIRRLIWERKLFPCYFGSALRMEGVREFLQGFAYYTSEPVYGENFGARVYKITRDEQGNRLTHMKITGGALQVRQMLTGRCRQQDGSEEEKAQTWSEKVNQIRIYSGERYEAVSEAAAGTVCAVTGLGATYPGEGLGEEQESELPILEPVLTYQILLSKEWDAGRAMPLLRQLEEEEPELHIVWDEAVGEIHAQIMGEVQIDIIKQQLWDRYRMEVEFGTGSIVYKETIAEPVVGIGHFEPLRHYAEVHLLLEPGEAGSGLQFEAKCSEDILAKNWQRLIMTHLEERVHRGVLTGSAITDMKISVIAGRAHPKHTEGGDFRQATYRAVRQGLRGAVNVLLEPYYSFRLTVPTEQLGRAMTDVERMSGKLDSPDTQGGTAVLTGIAPVVTMREYQRDLAAYTSGKGHLSCQMYGYLPCHDAEDVILARGYDPDADLWQTADSVFCSHGSGYIVPWNEVPEHAHVEHEYSLNEEERRRRQEQEAYALMSAAERRRQGYVEDYALGEEEIRSILGRASGANRSEKKGWKRQRRRTVTAQNGPAKSTSGKKREKYLLVDGYNIVFAWDALKALAEDNIDAARDRLMDILCNYQAYCGMTLILVFDAYKVRGGIGQMIDYHNIHVVYTKEAETADQYIEKLAHQIGHDYDVTVATSDGVVQLIILGQGCKLWSARDFEAEIQRVEERIAHDTNRTY